MEGNSFLLETISKVKRYSKGSYRKQQLPLVNIFDSPLEIWSQRDMTQEEIQISFEDYFDNEEPRVRRFRVVFKKVKQIIGEKYLK